MQTQAEIRVLPVLPMTALELVEMEIEIRYLLGML